MLDQTVEAGITTSLNDNRFSRPISGNTGYKFTGWNTAANGSGISYANGASVTDLVQAGSTITLYAQWESVTGPFLTVNFNGNDLTFDNSSNQNTVIYHRDCEQVSVQNPKYSHTSNVLDDGTQDGDYLDDEETNEVITIPGASSLHIELTFGGEYGYDWVSVWSGSHPDYSAYNDFDAEEMVILDEYYYDNQYASNDHTSSLVEGDISGDTVTFSFVSDSSYTVDSYGYYAVITGLDSNGDPISGTASVCSNTIISGEYKTPVNATSQKFYGWSESISATAPDYTNAKSIEDYLHGDNGQTKTLYAVWAAMHTIYFDENGADPAYGMVGNVQVITNGTSAELNEINYSKSGYKFKGWNTDSSATTALYADQAIFTAPSSALHTAGVTTLYAIWIPVYTVQYNINGGDSGTMGTHTNIAQGDEVTLYAPNFSRANYGFAGWSTDSNAQPGGNSTIYGPNETIVFPGYGDVTLYAIWVAKDTTYNLQTFATGNRCSTLSIGDVIALEDSRDGSVYTVGRLADGNCWTMENLRFEPAGKTLNASNTHNPDSTFANDVSALQSSSFATCTSNSSACFDQYSVGLNNLTSGNSQYNGGRQSYRWYAYGAMYNWHTATAGHGTYSMSSGVAEGDICPVDWHLPYGGNSSSVKGGNTGGGFYYLNRMLNGGSSATNLAAAKKLRAYPNNFVISGSYSGPSANGRGSTGYYWSSTASNNNSGNYFSVSNASVSTGTSSYSKYYGQAVRCVVAPRYDLTIDLNAGVEHVYVDGDEYDDGDTISLETNSPHTVSMTLASGYDFSSWSISGTGASVGNANPTTVSVGTTNATLTAIACANTITGNMQDALAPSAYCDGATGTMTDNRTTDTVLTPLTYTVYKYSNRLWMTQNLAITGTIPSSGSNFSGSSFNVSEYDLTDSTHCTSIGASDSNPLGYSNVCSHYYAGDANTGNKPTAWYNYAAVTAGSITGYSNSTTATSDICPSGWRILGTVDYNIIRDAVTAGITQFNLVYGGTYDNGSNYGATNTARWWSDLAQSSEARWALTLAGTALSASNTGRDGGFYIRCVRS
ncbi:InlB B-repeat-containing protein [Candidatus Saccharibacteria bacterium]|nr:InlB B-repeat-containing protein [Candidatus Saccharibacteria bacterium]